jgi:glycosyltransferase involved in cell wall biosynthesis
LRILICASEAPLPPVNGFRVMLKALVREVRREHEVRMLAFRSPGQEAPATGEDDMQLLPRPKGLDPTAILQMARAAAHGRPLRADRLGAPMVEPFLSQLSAFKPEVVHVTSGRLAGLGRVLVARPAVLGALDAMHLNVEARAVVATGLRKRLLGAEVGRVRKFEASEYGRFSHVVVVTEADRAALLEVDSSLDITVIPNGVDVAFFTPEAEASVDPQRIVFTGVMSYAPNVLAAEFLAREIFPRVCTAWPEARLAIVGRSPTPRVRALADLPGVEVTGEVPDIRPWLTGSRVYACPMTSGTGIKNKLLEAMACGLPCVVTPLALQGLDVVVEKHMLVGSSAGEIAREIGRVLRDADLAARLGSASRRYVCSEHDWSTVSRRYLRVWEEAVRVRQKRG